MTTGNDARPLLCRLGLHRFRGPGQEPFFGVFYEPFCLRGCGTPHVKKEQTNA